MTGIVGKKNSTLKKQGVKESKLLVTGVKSLRFWHEAQASGETSISFGSLSLPADIASQGLSNPTGGEITAANLQLFHTNVEVMSSLNGKLMEGLTYVVKNSQITLVNGYTTTEGEIFEVTYKNDVITGTNVVDARPLTKTGTLTAGNTTFIVGEIFKTNAYPSEQLGEVLVFVDGVLQFRNVGNATAAPAADGNYQEVHATGGYGNTIEFNSSYAYDVSVQVVSRNLIAERPDISMMQLIESLGGQLDKLVEYVAADLGVAESVFQAAPNQVDLAAFGNKVEQNTQDIAQNALDIDTKTTYLQDRLPVHYRITQIANNLINGSGEVEFNLGTATITKTNNDFVNVDDLMTASDDAPNTRTKFTFSEDCLVEVYGAFRSNTTGVGVEILKNGLIELAGTSPRTGTDSAHVSGPIYVQAGDYITLTSGFFGDNSGSVTAGLAPVLLNMKIQRL